MIDLSVFCFENEVTLSAFLQNLYPMDLCCFSLGYLTSSLFFFLHLRVISE